MSSRTQKVTITNEARVLKEMRLSVGLSMRAAGCQIGRSDTYISQIENGRMDVPKGERLEKLLGAYGGIKIRSFHERVRLYNEKASPKTELRQLIEKLQDRHLSTVATVVQSLLAQGDQ